MLRFNPSADPSYYMNAAGEWDTTLQWGGEMLKHLGVPENPIELYAVLVRNRDLEGNKLTQRDKKDRIPLFDATFSEPKSISIVRELTGDYRLQQARDESVYEIMKEVLEPLVGRSTRATGRHTSVPTENIAWLGFSHRLGRPVNGVPDMNGHTHITIPNVTHHEGKFWAIEPKTIRQSAPLIEAAWHARFEQKVRQLGYDTYSTKHGFEIKGIATETLRKYSRRTELIEGLAASKEHITEKQKAALGALTREQKSTFELEPEELRKVWDDRLTWKERDSLKVVAKKAEKGALKHSGKTPEDYAIDTFRELLKEKSAAKTNDLLMATLKAGNGEVQIADAVKEIQALQERPEVLVSRYKGVEFMTTRLTMQKERELVRKAQNGGITLMRIHRGAKFGNVPGQKMVVNATFEQLYEASQSANKVVAVYPYRYYLTPDRGNPNHFLEDFAYLKTQQPRPKPAIVQKIEKASRKLVNHLKRVRKISYHKELAYGGHRAPEVSRNVERQLGYER